MRPAKTPGKTQISLAIRPVWSESSLCALWVAKDLSFLHADSEDSDQTGRMPRLIWVFAGRTLTLLVLSRGGSIIIVISPKDSEQSSRIRSDLFWVFADRTHHFVCFAVLRLNFNALLNGFQLSETIFRINRPLLPLHVTCYNIICVPAGEQFVKNVVLCVFSSWLK